MSDGSLDDNPNAESTSRRSSQSSPSRRSRDFTVSPNRLADSAASSIRKLVAAEGLELGDPLPPIVRLADELVVSRTVVREAIRRLEADGYVKPSSRGRWVLQRSFNAEDGPASHVPEHRSLADQVADAILTMILTDEIGLGEPLPPARVLAERFDVSIVVVREALAALGSRGVLSRRQGREAVIALPEYDLLGSLLHVRAHLDDISSAEFQALRESIEVEAARLAAFSRYPGKRAVLEPHLRGMIEESGVVSNRIDHDLAFHLSIATLSGNRAIELMLNALHELIRRQMRVADSAVKDRAGARGLELSLATHERMFVAVVDGDIDGAMNAVHDHFHLIEHIS